MDRHESCLIEETEQAGIWFCRYDGFEHKILEKDGMYYIWRRGNYGYGAEAWDWARTLDEVKEKIMNAKNKYGRIRA